MAAPSKKGLDYFPFDVDLLNDVKLRKPKLKYGYLATMVYISLLSILYKDKGYYIDYSDQDNVVWSILEHLQGKYQPTSETVAEVVEDLVACGLFSGDQFESKKITSKRSQATYYSATVERKTVDIDDDIWLLSMEEMKSLSAKHCYYLKCLDRPINAVNRPINRINQPNNPQSKVKESKVNKNKQQPPKDGSCCSDISSCIELFESIKGRPLSQYEGDKVIDLTNTFGNVWVSEAFQIMADAGKCKLNYAEGILSNWQANGKDKAKPQKVKRKGPQVMASNTDYSQIFNR